MKISIIGDTFVDIFCCLDNTQNTPRGGSIASENSNITTCLLLNGGDTRMSQPVRSMAGGSGLNTATHLRSLIASNNNDEIPIQMNFHTVWNENDEHGKLIMEHCQQYGIPVINLAKESTSSTGHSIVLVSNGERSFLTYLGCIGQLSADDIDPDSILANNGMDNDHSISEYSGYHHIHIAGYFNIPGFWNGNLRDFVECIRRKKSNDTNLMISLVPQYDATEQWDGQILELLPFIDFLIMSQNEAECITRCTSDADIAEFLFEASPCTYAIVTRGAGGAVVFYFGTILHFQEAHEVNDVVDTTGAGDAFAAGFIYGFWDWNFKQLKNEIRQRIVTTESLTNGLRWGCAVGSKCVEKVGASVPSDKEDIEALLDLVWEEIVI